MSHEMRNREAASFDVLHERNFMSTTSSFEDFGLKTTLQESIKKCGFTAPTPIQAEVIPHILLGKDIVAQAKTGSGKTAAFGLPSLHLISDQPKKAGLLVITPTRELAIQVSDELSQYGKHSGMYATAVFGGSSHSKQISSIQQGASIIVATPGRLLDLLQSKRLKGFQPSIIVLDEADEMLDMGFLEDIQAIFEFLPEARQTLLFSATMPDPIQKLARKILKEPVFVKTGTSGFNHQDIEHVFYAIDRYDREEAFLRLLTTYSPTKSIIFCRTKRGADDLSTSLMQRGFSAKSLHGDMQQQQRQNVTNAFRAGGIQFLIATDVAARGLNISDVTHIFNYDIPFKAEDYVHRAGRTGRAGKKGTAVTLGTANELRKLRRMLNCTSGEIVMKSVPNAHDLYNIQLQNFIYSIQKHAVRQEASDILKKIQEKMDGSTLTLSLLSLLLDKKEFAVYKDSPSHHKAHAYEDDAHPRERRRPSSGRKEFSGRPRERKNFSFQRRK